jgi:hypothetical protein
MASISDLQKQGDFLIKSEATTPQLDSSNWPLLLKNYTSLLVRSSHFTPIPAVSVAASIDGISDPYGGWIEGRRLQRTRDCPLAPRGRRCRCAETCDLLA